MACDEVMLSGAAQPVLRHYQWPPLHASLGCTLSWKTAQRELPGRLWVRRWTGGGVVAHGDDWTFSLVLPAHSRAARLPARALYHEIHLAVAQALSACGYSVRLASEEEASPRAACFAGLSCGDVVEASGRKVCGGAQRRSRLGILYQGSLQGLAVPEQFLPALAHHLAEKVLPFVPPSGWEQLVNELAAQRYASRAWLERVP